ncbi:transglutaminase domain-containing protein [Rhizobium leguminosarum]|uniref:transglutaminase-like domain-containing protein n=1 Tax=Rhizobium ruizarguesonis TaxID=2081791 RepID=UPI00103DFD22|nr:transglutaminase-like domain-containing protein [Rhizobium ruizarguesonis]MBY5802664.1 transglutaminase domain-containing protein [Rhizobium leguminosarum]TCA73550.1 transglutaminase domain-containing protein [Rhizobium leguminosarum bv. viciae]MBY5843664.1 transglutaminase domain-containing protein [Rhizobium leguminosarum]NEH83937.1 transglutaminase domain-containing protein [Rhizobium ruizarguesonis]NEI11996.1 transglutaminase domain-containing protein [Rhizobium ruizarguesonis]
MSGNESPIEFYTRPGRMTSAGSHAPALAALQGVGAVAAAVHGTLLQDAWAQHYDQVLTPERRAQSHTRPAGEILDTIMAIDPAPLDITRPPDKRSIGTCRNFTVLACAALKAQSLPARARCGFGMYFEAGKGIDHWIVEYWDGERWVSADFQIDDLQRAALKLDFDPLDQPSGKFLSAGEAWQRCRAGTADPGKFGIFDESGFWFIAMNLVRDFAALNNMEMLPWDNWGSMPEPEEEMSADGLARFDRLAALTMAADERFGELRALYEDDAALRVPAQVFNGVRQQMEDVGSA